MIAFLPVLYEDELAYSWFARYHVQAGSMTYSITSELLFGKKNALPSTEFFPPLSMDMVRQIQEKMPLQDFAEKHTMLPYYIRFLPLERRKKALNLLVGMDKRYVDQIYVRSEKTYWKRYMRYCPLCAAQDREQYGETYWHRQHQIAEVEVCPAHRCRLEKSSVESICNRQRFRLVAAEIAVPYEKEIHFTVTEQECRMAEMAATILKEKINLKDDVPIGEFLHSKLAGTAYTSPRGENVYAGKLYEDMEEHYKGITKYPFKAWWQVQKVFCGQNYHTFDICLIANSLGILVEQLLHPTLPEKPLHERFDEQLMQLRRQGLTQKQIAERLGLSIHIIKETEEKIKKRLA